jgi:adenosylcobyric acid synthase
LGICAGYQMLGHSVQDPLGVEGPAGGKAAGLGLLDVDTIMAGDKILTRIHGHDAHDLPVSGYEMHMGRTEGPDRARPFLWLDGQPDGAQSANGLVAGCYLHGLFAGDAFRHGFLRRIRTDFQSDLSYDGLVDSLLDQLADHLEAHVDIPALLTMASAAMVKDGSGLGIALGTAQHGAKI